MFDDQPIQGQGKPPANLPMGEPEDIFASTGASDPAPSPVEAGGPDMTAPAAPASALDAGVLKPKTPPPVGQPTVRAMPKEFQSGPTVQPPMQRPSAPPAGVDYEIKKPSLMRELLLVVVIIAALLAIAGGGWWAYARFIANRETPIVVPPAAPTPTDDEPSDPIDNPPASPDVSGSVVDDTVLFGEPIDTDNDGLDNSREESLGTDPKNWDTDLDELGDGDEVTIWKTDPRNPDTDGDGFRDGAEVKNGYSPAGPGKIFEPPAPATTTF